MGLEINLTRNRLFRILYSRLSDHLHSPKLSLRLGPVGHIPPFGAATFTGVLPRNIIPVANASHLPIVLRHPHVDITQLPFSILHGFSPVSNRKDCGRDYRRRMSVSASADETLLCV